jgi:hypothetical protein
MHTNPDRSAPHSQSAWKVRAWFAARVMDDAIVEFVSFTISARLNSGIQGRTFILRRFLLSAELKALSRSIFSTYTRSAVLKGACRSKFEKIFQARTYKIHYLDITLAGLAPSQGLRIPRNPSRLPAGDPHG